jgi:predicted acylesterase/phospholipase RssA/CRP-like cAMP-binding protein
MEGHPGRPLIDALAAAGTVRTCDPGEVLCAQGDESEEAFVITSGRVATMVNGHTGEMVVAEHGEGGLVGEVTTLIGGHRTATLVTTEPTTVAVVDRATLMSVFEEHPDEAGEILRTARERTARAHVAALISQELQASDGGAVAAIAAAVSWRPLAAGEVLFRRGDPADAAYLLVSGRLGITDMAASGPHGSSIEIGRGAIVGEFGLLESRARSATITALRDSTLARLAGDDFRAMTVRHAPLAMGLVRRIIERAGNDVATAATARSFALIVTADVDPVRRQALVGTMVAALHACGSTLLLSAEVVDETLRHEGIADTPIGSFGEVRLAELLHQSETDADMVMFDAGPLAGLADDPRSNWTRRSLVHADQVVIVASARPDAHETARIRRLLEIAPARIPRWLALLHPAHTRRATGGRSLRERFGVDEVHHLHDRSDTDLGRLARLAAGRGVGLVLSGGGARGHAHLGVHRALTEQGIPIDRVVGASMGAIVAGMIAQGGSPDETLSDMRNGARKLLDYTLPIVSLVKGDRIVKVLEQQFGDCEIEDLWIPFACLSTNMTTAQPVVHRRGTVTRAIRSSISIPGVLPPVVDGDSLIADGGVLDNLPVGLVSSDSSIGTIIASDVAPPLGPRAHGDYGLSVNGWGAIKDKVMPQRLLRRRGTLPAPRLPSLGGTLMRAMLIGSSQTRDQHIASGVIDLYLDLDLRTVSLLDFAQVDQAARHGYDSANDLIAAWLQERGGSVWGMPCSS